MKRQKEKEYAAEAVLYWTGIKVIALLFLVVGSIYLLRFCFPQAAWLKSISECAFYKMTGIPCPSCGGTRALINFFQGHWLKSIYYHAAVFYACLLTTFFFLTQTLQRLSGGRIPGLRWHAWYWKAGIGIYIFQYIFKLAFLR